MHMPTAGLFVTCIRIGVECKCNILGLLTKKVLLLTTPKAPTANACGLAGGTPWGAEVGEAGDYTNTTFAHHGMKGTDLKPLYTEVSKRARLSYVNITCFSLQGMCMYLYATCHINASDFQISLYYLSIVCRCLRFNG